MPPGNPAESRERGSELDADGDREGRLEIKFEEAEGDGWRGRNCGRRRRRRREGGGRASRPGLVGKKRKKKERRKEGGEEGCNWAGPEEKNKKERKEG